VRNSSGEGKTESGATPRCPMRSTNPDSSRVIKVCLSRKSGDLAEAMPESRADGPLPSIISGTSPSSDSPGVEKSWDSEEQYRYLYVEVIWDSNVLEHRHSARDNDFLPLVIMFTSFD